MTRHVIDVRISGPNALWVENKGYDVRSGGDRGVGNLVDNADGERVVSIFGPGFSEELPRAATGGTLGAASDGGSDRPKQQL